MEEKLGLLETVAKSIRCKAHRLGSFVAEEFKESENEAQERAHLATIGDHPFIGCSPCQPGDVIPLSNTAPNPAATARSENS